MRSGNRANIRTGGQMEIGIKKRASIYSGTSNLNKGEAGGH